MEQHGTTGRTWSHDVALVCFESSPGGGSTSCSSGNPWNNSPFGNLEQLGKGDFRLVENYSELEVLGDAPECYFPDSITRRFTKSYYAS